MENDEVSFFKNPKTRIFEIGNGRVQSEIGNVSP